MLMNNNRLRKRIGVVFTLFMIVFVICTSVLSGLSAYADTDTTDTVAVSEKADGAEAEKAEGTETAAKADDTKAEDTQAETEAKTDGEKKEYTNRYSSKGIFATIAVPFGYVVWAFYKLIPDYGVALLFYAIVMKIVLFPFGIKQQKNSVKQASLRPKEMAIRNKYAGRNDKATQQKMQQEVMELYQRENFNPMGGCLPLLLQFPILFALYQVVYNPLRHISHVGVDKIAILAQKVVDAGLGDVTRGDIDIVNLLTNPKNSAIAQKILDEVGVEKSKLVPIKMFGVDLSGIPGFSGDALKLIWIPIVTFITVYLSMKLTKKMTYQPVQAGDAGKSTVVMDLVMPLMSTWFTFLFPAILGVYWIFQNLLGIVQQYILMKMYPIPQFTEEEYKAAEREMKGKEIKKKKAPANQGPAKRHPNSLHHIDDDDDDIPAPRPSKPTAGASKAPEAGIIPPAELKEDIPHEGKTVLNGEVIDGGKDE